MTRKSQIMFNLKLFSTKNLYRLAIKKEWIKKDIEKIKNHAFCRLILNSRPLLAELGPLLINTQCTII
jgi:hypothetical protein